MSINSPHFRFLLNHLSRVAIAVLSGNMSGLMTAVVSSTTTLGAMAPGEKSSAQCDDADHYLLLLGALSGAPVCLVAVSWVSPRESWRSSSCNPRWTHRRNLSQPRAPVPAVPIPCWRATRTCIPATQRAVVNNTHHERSAGMNYHGESVSGVAAMAMKHTIDS
eukprot:592350-Amphidinium_carterae.1